MADRSGRIACAALLLVLLVAGCETKPPAAAGDGAGLASATGAMTYKRASFPAVALQSGKVLVVGGVSSDLPYTGARAELYDPATGTFTPTGSLSVGRSEHVAALLPDGRVLVSGGRPDGGGDTITDELYDPATGAWTVIGSDVSRAGPASATLADGKVLVAGGRGAVYPSVLSSARVFDPATESFWEVGSTLTPRYGATATLLDDGRVLVAGGASSGGYFQSVAELFDPATGTWSAAAPMHVTRGGHTATKLPDGRVLVTGGVGDKTTELYDPVANTWAWSASMSTMRSEHRAALLPDGSVLVLGGQNGAGPLLATGERWVLGSGFVGADPLGVARRSFGLAPLPGGRFLVAGGVDYTGTYGATAEVYQYSCTPTPCLPGWCGTMPDGCGGTQDCGGCPDGSSCRFGSCCAPKTCASLGRSCGDTYDGCGGTLSCGTCAPGFTCSTAGACELTAATAAYDPTLKAPRCSSAAPACDTGTLVVGRATLGPEWNAPNTLRSSCGDGTGGTFHVDESLDRLRVSSADGGPLTVGRAARIEATVWAYGAYSSDRLDLWATSDALAATPVWTPVATLSPTRAGAQTLSATYTVPAGGAAQAVRGVFRYGGTASPCAPGSYNEADDVVFAVVQPPDVEPPTIAITSPAPGAVVRGTVTIAVAVGDDVGVTAVTCLDGATVVGAATAAPFSISWATRTGQNGPHDLTCTAQDASGKSATSAAVTVVTDNDFAPPTVQLVAPAPGATVSGTVAVGVLAADDVGVARVDYALDGTVFASTTLPPFSAQWFTTAFANGSHVLTATARDAAGNAAVSAPVQVTIANDRTPPTTTLTSPAPGAILAGTVTLAATASDDGGVARVEFWDGASLLGTSTSAPHSYAWNTLSAANGSHTLSTRAYDPAGNVGTSAGVSVTVSNAAAPVITGTFDAALRAPRCPALGSGCDSGALLVGRAGLGPETNAPNTLGATCADGASGSYHSDESLDRLRVVTVDGTPLAPGKTVRVEATVWAYSSYTSDKLDLYYAPDAAFPVWKLVATLTPTRSGASTLTASYVLPAGAQQVVRAVFRYAGTAGVCTTGPYDDHDDLVFVTE